MFPSYLDSKFTKQKTISKMTLTYTSIPVASLRAKPRTYKVSVQPPTRRQTEQPFLWFISVGVSSSLFRSFVLTLEFTGLFLPLSSLTPGDFYPPSLPVPDFLIGNPRYESWTHCSSKYGVCSRNALYGSVVWTRI